MNENMLNSLMRLFALVASINREALHMLARSFVDSYLSQQFSRKLADRFLVVFDEYSLELETTTQRGTGKKISAVSVKIMGICEQINRELHIRHRFQILLSLIQFSKYFEDSNTARHGYAHAISDAVETVGEGLQIHPDEYANCRAFIVDKFYKVPNKERILVISDDRNFMFTEIRHLQKDQLPGQIFVLRILRADTYLFQYIGKERLEVNNRYVFPRHVYLLPRGGSIKGKSIAPIYYSDIVSGFLGEKDAAGVDFLAEDIEFRFRNSSNGIHRFSFQARSGQLVGVMGGSGTGKSTLLKVLTGELPLNHGRICINGHDLHHESRELEGVIGYIPQDDLLIEELSVFENLYYNAKLCLNDHDEAKIRERVVDVLEELDLQESRDLKVGSPLNKFISGGQRKRLNIALELIREPFVLFVDEPTSGLSSTDSENVMMLLKELAMKGKLVLVNIHQPSSDLFKLFDQLVVMDRGGYPVYSGNPIEGIIYFKQLTERVDAGESECVSCGTTRPEEILQIIEERDVNEYGEFMRKRKNSPEDWYRKFMDNIQSGLKLNPLKSDIPENIFSIPGPFRQFLIFFMRNLMSKLADRQFLSIALLVSPVLAFILGYFTKYVSGDAGDPHAYVFSHNENLPAYLFMSVIVALFLGMIISAEEIIKDRKILERESFLHLSRNAYLLSKVAFLFLLSAIQMMLFVLIGNAILGIKGMTLNFWLVLFATSCFANIVGLNISDGLKSVVAIYVVVPFLLVPQILLAGVIVKFDKLHFRFASHEAVPFVGDLMASRWAYEAMMVGQFVNNPYQKRFYSGEMQESNIVYDMQFLVPTLIQEIQDARSILVDDPKEPEMADRLNTIRMGLEGIFLTEAYEGIGNMLPERFSAGVADDAIAWLQDYRGRLNRSFEAARRSNDQVHHSLQEELGGTKAMLEYKQRYLNESLANLVLSRIDLHKIIKVKGRLIRKMEPVYMYPLKANGRAHFFASVKRVGGTYLSTELFNNLAIWLMCMVLYFTLRYSLLGRSIDYFATMRRKQKKS